MTNPRIDDKNLKTSEKLAILFNQLKSAYEGFDTVLRISHILPKNKERYNELCAKITDIITTWQRLYNIDLNKDMLYKYVAGDLPGETIPLPNPDTEVTHTQRNIDSGNRLKQACFIYCCKYLHEHGKQWNKSDQSDAIYLMNALQIDTTISSFLDKRYRIKINMQKPTGDFSNVINIMLNQNKEIETIVLKFLEDKHKEISVSLQGMQEFLDNFKPKSDNATLGRIKLKYHAPGDINDIRLLVRQKYALENLIDKFYKENFFDPMKFATWLTDKIKGNENSNPFFRTYLDNKSTVVDVLKIQTPKSNRVATFFSRELPILEELQNLLVKHGVKLELAQPAATAAAAATAAPTAVKAADDKDHTAAAPTAPAATTAAAAPENPDNRRRLSK